MSLEKEKNRFVQKMRDKYRLVIHNDSTFEEVVSLRLSRLNVFTVTGFFSVLLIGIVTILIAFTPIREYIPGYPDAQMRQTIQNNSFMVDSLVLELDKRDRFFVGIKNIVSGNDFDNIEQSEADSIIDPRYKDLIFAKSEEDSLFRLEVEEEERYNLAVNQKKKITNISGIHFFPPVRGLVSNHYNATESHFGTDIVSAKNERISAVLGGTIIMAAWTLNSGYVIQIQHTNNLISIYKHNASLLKKVGEQVKLGEAIALLGNSGEMTSGPHLHFELWHKGKALNAEDFIKF